MGVASHSVKIRTVHHESVLIEASPDLVWRNILGEYVHAEKFREMGYSIEPIDAPEAILGGYRMRLAEEGVTRDERLIYITERDDAVRRLSLFADYLSEPNGLQVHATYHAQAVAGGTLYVLDCHANPDIEVGHEQHAAGIRAAAAAATAQNDASLREYLQSVKARVESSIPPARAQP